MKMEEHVQSKIKSNGSQKSREALTKIEKELRSLAEMAIGKRPLNKPAVYKNLYTIMNDWLPDSFDGVEEKDFVSVKAIEGYGEISLDIRWNPQWVKNVEENYPEMYMGSI